MSPDALEASPASKKTGYLFDIKYHNSSNEIKKPITFLDVNCIGLDHASVSNREELRKLITLFLPVRGLLHVFEMGSRTRWVL